MRSCADPGAIISFNFKWVPGSVDFVTLPPGKLDTSFTYTQPGTYTVYQLRGGNEFTTRTVKVFSQDARPVFSWKTCIDTLAIQMNDSVFSAFRFLPDASNPTDVPITGGNTLHRHRYNFSGNQATYIFTIKGDLPATCSKQGVSDTVTLYKTYQPPPSDSLVGTDTLNYRATISTKADVPFVFQTNTGAGWLNLFAGMSPNDNPKTVRPLSFSSFQQKQRIRVASATGCGDTLPAPDWTVLWPQIQPDNQKITISWPLFSISGLVQFDILRDGQKLATITDLTDTTFVDSGSLVCGQTYCYRFLMRREVVGHSGLLVYLSAPVCGQAISNRAPDPVQRVWATVKSEGIEITGKASALAKTFSLYRRERETDEYTKLLNFNAFPVLDTNADFNHRAYCYRIGYVDKCGNQSVLSDSICPVWLRMEERNVSERQFFWTDFDGIKGSVKRYELYRYSAFDSPITFDMELNNSYLLEGRDRVLQKITYFIKAYPNDGSQPVSVSNTIEVVQHSQLRFPEVFTPNDDKVNDAFNCYSFFLKDYELKIFNAWGEIVYETDRVERGWNGKIDEKPAASGVYAYTAKGTDEEGNKLETKGYFTLVR